MLQPSVQAQLSEEHGVFGDRVYSLYLLNVMASRQVRELLRARHVLKPVALRPAAPGGEAVAIPLPLRLGYEEGIEKCRVWDRQAMIAISLQGSCFLL